MNIKRKCIDFHCAVIISLQIKCSKMAQSNSVTLVNLYTQKLNNAPTSFDAMMPLKELIKVLELTIAVTLTWQ